MNGDNLVIDLSGKIDSNNAADIEDQVNEILATTGTTTW